MTKRGAISLSFSLKQPHLEVTVSDTGAGMDEIELKLLMNGEGSD